MQTPDTPRMGRPPKDESELKVAVSTAIPRDLLERLDAECAARRCTRSHLLRVWIEDAIEDLPELA